MGLEKGVDGDREWGKVWGSEWDGIRVKDRVGAKFGVGEGYLDRGE